MDDELDVKFMRLAIEHARLSADGTDETPTPRVGAVVVSEGEILACAHRGEMGPGDHAEFVALEGKLAGRDLSGATVYTTLEPCTDRAPTKIACAVRLISRKVRRVVIGVLDPNPLILGRGWLALQDAGILVTVMGNDFGRTIRGISARFEAIQRAKQRPPGAGAPLVVPKRRVPAPMVEMAVAAASDRPFDLGELEASVSEAFGHANDFVDGSPVIDEELAVTTSIDSPAMATRYARGASMWCAIRVETAGTREFPATLLGGLRVDTTGRTPSLREVLAEVPSFLQRVATLYTRRVGTRLVDSVAVHLDGVPVLDLQRAADGAWFIRTGVKP